MQKAHNHIHTHKKSTITSSLKLLHHIPRVTLLDIYNYNYVGTVHHIKLSSDFIIIQEPLIIISSTDYLIVSTSFVAGEEDNCQVVPFGNQC